MKDLFQRSTPGENTENEGDVTDVCDLADDLSDAIVEYQVGTDMKGAHQIVHLFMQLAVLTAEGDLRSKLCSDCMSWDSRFGKTLSLIGLCRMQVGYCSGSGWYTLMIQRS